MRRQQWKGKAIFEEAYVTSDGIIIENSRKVFNYYKKNKNRWLDKKWDFGEVSSKYSQELISSNLTSLDETKALLLDRCLLVWTSMLISPKIRNLMVLQVSLCLKCVLYLRKWY